MLELVIICYQCECILEEIKAFFSLLFLPGGLDVHHKGKCVSFHTSSALFNWYRRTSFGSQQNT